MEWYGALDRQFDWELCSSEKDCIGVYRMDGGRGGGAVEPYTPYPVGNSINK